MTIRWGILGCGKVCEVKSGPALQRVDGSELVLVMRRDAALAEDYARRHGVARWTTDADALIHDPQVDAVYIATPPGNHLEYALRVAAANKPAYVEKPMARNYAECRRMIEAFAASAGSQPSRPLFVAYYRRRLPRFLKVRELMEAGRLGQPTMLTYRYASNKVRRIAAGPLEWRLVAEHSGGGLFLDLASHALDIFDFLFGPIEQVQGAAANAASPFDVEDVVALQCRFANGMLGVASWNFAAAAAEDLIEISGAEGAISLSVFGDDPVRLATTSGAEQFELPNPPHIQQPLIQSIVDELHGAGQCPSSGETAARTSRVMDEVLASYYGGRDDAFWSRSETWPGAREARSRR
jgi:1,5-anhydro-D-fructose reductase (1,5-anhydro-D-mannitol-forming)